MLQRLCQYYIYFQIPLQMMTVYLVKIRIVIFYEVGDCGTAVLAHLHTLIIPPTTRGVTRDLKVQCFLYRGTPPDKLYQTYIIHAIVSSNNTHISSFGDFVGKFRQLPEFVKKLKNNTMHNAQMFKQIEVYFYFHQVVVMETKFKLGFC